MLQQNDHLARTEKIILELNKSGLSYLTHKKYSEAFDYFKQSQKLVLHQLKVDSQNLRVNKLAGITYNNLACYYKKTNKPKISLIYLIKALQIEVDKVEDWAATAATHLNICAIHSFRNQHQFAANHAQLALEMLCKLTNEQLTNDNNTKSLKSIKKINLSEQKSINNLWILAHYNLAVEYEHLKRYEESIEQFSKARQLGKQIGKKHVGIIMACDSSIVRLKSNINQLKNKWLRLISKKQEEKEKGFYHFIRLNKKNKPSKKKSKSPQIKKLNIAERLKKLKIYQQQPSARTRSVFRLKTSSKTHESQKNFTIKQRNSCSSNISFI